MKILNHKLEDLPNLKYNTMIDYECDNCKKVYQKNRKIIFSNIKRGRKHLFCSKNCTDAFRRKPINLSPSNCLECGATFYKNTRFCSRICACKFANQKRWQNHIPKPKPRIKIDKPSIIYCVCDCEQCQKQIKRTKYQLSDKKNKNKLVFCSRSCRMTHQNLNNPKKYGCRKSKAETFLFNLIKTNFPHLEVRENDRTVLNSKLEIDIFIPEFKLAIELNGPVHYFPIYGENKLKKCQNNDLIKQQEIHNSGLSLIVIDISRLCSKKKTESFLSEYYQSIISPILNGCRGGS